MSTPSSSTTVAALPFNVNNTLGALLVGGLLATALWGITSAQTFVYYQRRGNDPLRFKLLVALLWCLDTFDTILNCHILYHYLISNYMNPAAIGAPVWSLILHASITSSTDCIIRGLFARRIYRLSDGSVILTAGIVALTITDIICGITITVKGWHFTVFSQLKSISTLFYLDFAAGFSGDLYVALVLCFYLCKARTGFQRTDNLIIVLMVYAINTGLLTSIDALLGMLFYITMPKVFVFIPFYFILSKMYLNSYLATLNAREHLREKNDGVVSIRLSHLQPSSNTYGTEFDSQPSPASKKGNELTIKVETEVSSKTEAYDDQYGRDGNRRPRVPV